LLLPTPWDLLLNRGQNETDDFLKTFGDGEF
jgi:hypothetical protein